jgi:hypothetical protein
LPDSVPNGSAPFALSMLSLNYSSLSSIVGFDFGYFEIFLHFLTATMMTISSTVAIIERTITPPTTLTTLSVNIEWNELKNAISLEIL